MHHECTSCLAEQLGTSDACERHSHKVTSGPRFSSDNAGDGPAPASWGSNWRTASRGGELRGQDWRPAGRTSSNVGSLGSATVHAPASRALAAQTKFVPSGTFDYVKEFNLAPHEKHMGQPPRRNIYGYKGTNRRICQQLVTVGTPGATTAVFIDESPANSPTGYYVDFNPEQLGDMIMNVADYWEYYRLNRVTIDFTTVDESSNTVIAMAITEDGSISDLSASFRDILQNPGAKTFRAGMEETVTIFDKHWNEEQLYKCGDASTDPMYDTQAVLVGCADTAAGGATTYGYLMVQFDVDFYVPTPTQNFSLFPTVSDEKRLFYALYGQLIEIRDQMCKEYGVTRRTWDAVPDNAPHYPGAPPHYEHVNSALKTEWYKRVAKLDFKAIVDRADPEHADAKQLSLGLRSLPGFALAAHAIATLPKTAKKVARVVAGGAKTMAIGEVKRMVNTIVSDARAALGVSTGGASEVAIHTAEAGRDFYRGATKAAQQRAPAPKRQPAPNRRKNKRRNKR